MVPIATLIAEDAGCSATDFEQWCRANGRPTDDWAWLCFRAAQQSVAA